MAIKYFSDLDIANDVTLSGNNPTLALNDSNGRSADLRVVGNNFTIRDISNNASIFTTDLSANPTTTTFNTVSTFVRAVTVGEDGSGHDVKFFGDASGEFMQYDASDAKLKIVHTDESVGLEVYTNAAAQTTQAQLKVGRAATEYWGVFTADRDAVLIHRQDESSGTMNTKFQQWDSNTSDTTGTWQWQFGDGSGSSLATAMTLTQAGALSMSSIDVQGDANLAGTTTVASVLGTSAKFGRDADNLIDFATTDNQIRFRVNGGDEANMTNAFFYPHSNDGMGLGFGGNAWSDLFLASGGVINFNNGDMTITHSSNKLTISGGTTTINSLELGAADHVIEDGANILDENDNTLFTLASGNVGVGANLTVGGTITTPSDIIHTGDTDTKISFGTNTVTVTAGNVNTVVASQEGASITKRKFAKTSNTDGTGDGDIVYLGNTTSMSAGAIYHFKSDGTWEKADADAASTCDGLLGVALGASSDDNGVLLRGMVTIANDPGAVGDVLFLSTTAGQATATAPSGNGDIVRVIGYCLDASNGQIFFNPDGTFVEVTA